MAPPGAIIVHVCARTDVGRSREHNEDAFMVADLSIGEPMQFDGVVTQRASDRGQVFMVADGMGGAAAGEIASEMAVGIVLDRLRQAWRESPTADPLDFVAAIRESTEAANAAIHQFAIEHPEFRGMGTTATVAGLLGDTLYLAQVGDSRGYLVRDGVAIQITKDQSLMQKLIEAGEITPEEAEQSDRKNIILQALGPDSAVKIDLTHQPVRRNDTLILCSDGLSGLVKPDQIALAVNEEPELDRLCERLIATANEAGGPDNITVVAVRFDGTGLEDANTSDVIGHQHFSTGEGDTPITVPLVRLDVPPEYENATSAAPVILPPDPERQEKGTIVLRLLVVLGVVLAALVLWKLLGRF
jgi:PPM family protein phosphatase